MSFVLLGNLLEDSLKKAGVFNQVNSALILDQFSSIIKEIFGVKLSAKIKPLYVKNKTLNVACLNSVLAQELRLREQEILKKLNTGKKIVAVERIRYLV